MSSMNIPFSKNIEMSLLFGQSLEIQTLYYQPIPDNSFNPSKYYLLPKNWIDEYKNIFNYHLFKPNISEFSDYNSYKFKILADNVSEAKNSGFSDISKNNEIPPIEKHYIKNYNCQIEYPVDFFPVREEVFKHLNIIPNEYLYEIIIGNNNIFVIDNKSKKNIFVCSLDFDKEDIDDFIVNVNYIIIYENPNIFKKEMKNHISKKGFEKYCKEKNLNLNLNELQDIKDKENKLGIFLPINNNINETPDGFILEYHLQEIRVADTNLNQENSLKNNNNQNNSQINNKINNQNNNNQSYNNLVNPENKLFYFNNNNQDNKASNNNINNIGNDMNLDNNQNYDFNQNYNHNNIFNQGQYVNHNNAFGKLKNVILSFRGDIYYKLNNYNIQKSYFFCNDNRINYNNNKQYNNYPQHYIEHFENNNNNYAQNNYPNNQNFYNYKINQNNFPNNQNYYNYNNNFMDKNINNNNYNNINNMNQNNYMHNNINQNNIIDNNNMNQNNIINNNNNNNMIQNSNENNNINSMNNKNSGDNNPFKNSGLIINPQIQSSKF